MATTAIQSSPILTRMKMLHSGIAAANPVKEKRTSKWMRLAKEFWQENDEPPSGYYRSVPGDEIIKYFGHFKPIHAGRPKSEAMELLMAASGEYKCPRQYHYKNLGLMYFTGYIAGRKSMRCRLTVAGLALLDHWGKRENFKKFVDAFVSKKARREIIKDCVMFELGQTPVCVERAEALHEKNLKRVDAIKKEMERIKAREEAWQAKLAKQYQTTLMPQWQQTNINPWYPTIGSGHLLGLTSATPPPKTLTGSSTDPRTGVTTYYWSDGTQT